MRHGKLLNLPKRSTTLAECVSESMASRSRRSEGFMVVVIDIILLSKLIDWTS